MSPTRLMFLKTPLSTLVLSACVAVLGPSLLQLDPQALAATSAAANLPDFSGLVEKVGPAVVNVRTTRKVSKPGDDDAQGGVGSGFIVSPDGYVMTNAHVVKDADEVYVRLTDQREFKAKVIGADARTDVALLKIEGSKLPRITLGNSTSAKVGEWVIAIGSPFDLDNTVTAGIISAKARETGDFLPFIQTDVAINPGNSGGPLINMRGEVVGINSQIYSRSGGYMGISFAIPINDAIRVSEQLKAVGRVTRGRLGVYLLDVNKEIAESLGLPRAQGAMVGRTEKGGPAEQAGLLDGDIVLSFNEVQIEKSAELRRLAAATPPGTPSRLTVWRKGAAQEVTLTLAELEQEKEAPAVDRKPQAEPAVNVLGMAVTNLTDAQKKELRVASGVVINKVEGSAARAGLRPGDRVITANNVDVQDAAQFATLVAQADPQKLVLLLIRRGENSQFLALRPTTP